jgi:hypothetical protein
MLNHESRRLHGHYDAPLTTDLVLTFLERACDYVAVEKHAFLEGADPEGYISLAMGEARKSVLHQNQAEFYTSIDEELGEVLHHRTCSAIRFLRQSQRYRDRPELWEWMSRGINALSLATDIATDVYYRQSLHARFHGAQDEPTDAENDRDEDDDEQEQHADAQAFPTLLEHAASLNAAGATPPPLGIDCPYCAGYLTMMEETNGRFVACSQSCGFTLVGAPIDKPCAACGMPFLVARSDFQLHCINVVCGRQPPANRVR